MAEHRVAFNPGWNKELLDQQELLSVDSARTFLQGIRLPIGGLPGDRRLSAAGDAWPKTWKWGRGKNPRKLVYKVEPQYPGELKRAYIGGMVRLDVLISPRGTVQTVSIAGGNPVLAECAAKAVKQWKYAPADAQTSVRLNVKFDPRHWCSQPTTNANHFRASLHRVTLLRRGESAKCSCAFWAQFCCVSWRLLQG